MVMNLDKCIGCHTCSITCKNVWTNREGAEYMYFNNVETKPGIGYPKNWEDQEKWKGGWKFGKDGKLSLRTGSKPERLLKLFYHPDQPEMDDYYEPWTYDYETLIHSKRRNHQPIARPRSLITGERMEIKWGRTGRTTSPTASRPARTSTSRRSRRTSRSSSTTSS